MDEMRAMLDSLMGRDRNACGSNRKGDYSFKDEEVCKFYLLDYCPHELFPNTRSDLGPCPKEHRPDLKEAFEKDENHDYYKALYEQEFMKFLKRLVDQMESRIKRVQQRIDANNTAAELDKDTTEKVNAVNAQISELLKKQDDAGAKGEIDVAEKLNEEVALLQREVQRLKNPHADIATIRESQLRVCAVCGALQSAGDALCRYESHASGKQHRGFEKIRSSLAKLVETESEREALLNKHPLHAGGSRGYSGGASSGSAYSRERHSAGGSGANSVPVADRASYHGGGADERRRGPPGGGRSGGGGGASSSAYSRDRYNGANGSSHRYEGSRYSDSHYSRGGRGGDEDERRRERVLSGERGGGGRRYYDDRQSGRGEGARPGGGMAPYGGRGAFHEEGGYRSRYSDRERERARDRDGGRYRWREESHVMREPRHDRKEEPHGYEESSYRGRDDGRRASRERRDRRDYGRYSEGREGEEDYERERRDRERTRSRQANRSRSSDGERRRESGGDSREGRKRERGERSRERDGDRERREAGREADDDRLEREKRRRCDEAAEDGQDDRRKDRGGYNAAYRRDSPPREDSRKMENGADDAEKPRSLLRGEERDAAREKESRSEEKDEREREIENGSED